MHIILAFLAALALAGGAQAQPLSALARLDPSASRIDDTPAGLMVELQLSQGVPWRVRVAVDPPRLILDFREVDFAPLAAVPGIAARVADRRAGPVAGGWSRLVLTLTGPHPVETAEMRTGPGGALVRVRLGPADAAAFAAAAAAPDPDADAWRLPAPTLTATPRPRGAEGRPLVVMLDPGHGGIDPGAEHGGVTEAALMLTFARELREALRRAGFAVEMTRDADVFVPLDARVAAAHAAGADLLLSLHADAVTEGEATGATVYTLAEEASDAAAAALAERHDRDSLIAGASLRGQDDLVARVLMDLARTETTPRADRLADVLVAQLRAAGLRLHRVPRRGAAFSVLRSPAVPSALIELGYLSSARDRERLRDPEWRARMVAAVVAGVQDWAVADAAEAALIRQ